ncbi:hypothetical protein TNCT_252391 [Trichonephila clavata]|uniref:Uncharacterized protein n=1 Tax=Trichonephila clavata TaxID=2740835 RepID=A0A8X6HE54_TRICU|nr:hypothetical protein TNCT_252391 [Trichonephila clavata]
MDPRLYPKGAGHASDAIPKRFQDDIFGDGVSVILRAGVKREPPQKRATAEPERIPTSPAKSASPPAKSASPPENIPTPPENIPTPPAKRLVESVPESPVTPLERVDPSLLMTGAHVEVTSRLPTPPLMTRCDKSTQTNSPRLELGKRLLERPPLLPNKRLDIQPKTPVQQPPLLFCLCPTIIQC